MTIQTDSPKNGGISWPEFKWPMIVTVLLAGHAFLITGALLLSSTLIPSASTTPAGPATELKWDDLVALRGSSKQLGWTLEVTPTDRTELNGDRHVRFDLRNAIGEPIPDAELFVILYHHNRPYQPIEARFDPPDDASGTYNATLRIGREGLWRLSATAQRGEDRFLVEADFWIGKPAEES